MNTMTLKPPDRGQLAGSEPMTLDAKDVVEHFLGKTQEEARRMFPARSSAYSEDFMWMAADGLRYYLPAALAYLKSEECKDDWEFCHGLLCSLSMQVDWRKTERDIVLLIKDVATYADAHRGKFRIEPSEKLFNKYVEKIGTAKV